MKNAESRYFVAQYIYGKKLIFRHSEEQSDAAIQTAGAWDSGLPRSARNDESLQDSFINLTPIFNIFI